MAPDTVSGESGESGDSGDEFPECTFCEPLWCILFTFFEFGRFASTVCSLLTFDAYGPKMTPLKKYNPPIYNAYFCTLTVYALKTTTLSRFSRLKSLNPNEIIYALRGAQTAPGAPLALHDLHGYHDSR